MKVIHKFQLETYPGRHELMVPKGAELLTLNYQRGNVVAYFLVDENQMIKEKFTYVAVWTGKPFDIHIELEYLDSITLYKGIVVHYFEEAKDLDIE